MTDPFWHEVVLYLLKIMLAGVGFLTASAIAVQFYFKRAIPHEAKKSLIKKKIVDDGTKANAGLLARFERDLERLKDELAATRKSLSEAASSEGRLAQENRYLQGKVEALTAEIAELRKTQPEFLAKMDKFILSLSKLKEKPIPGSGGKTRVGSDPA